ncbi:hypothetical protein [Parendozoicomonas haliclonae]|uniref:Ethanolamine utilization protein n=1 Tax=Parendozoicomonas haliclonae TaxID=1960125 RepID=A0A1X7ALD1_9GAMM|nr:hypothetical protein [Parendozoicomonas haliclonae]SMA48783.1 hypothetical protein EHSB41UT_02894 [Parendozoicomonas haliclonae]
MNTEALIELISRRVMEQLLQAGTTIVPAQAAARKESVLVLGQDGQAVRESLWGHFEVTLLEEVEQPSAADYDHIVLANLPNKLLGEMAIGLERGADGCVIVESLMMGKTVHILDEGIAFRRFKATANPAFFQVFEDKVNTLVGYGMQVVNQACLKDVLSGKAVVQAAVRSAEQAAPVVEAVRPVMAGAMSFVGKRVISERDLERANEQGYTVFEVPETALLTPLAKDFVRLNHLHLNRV